VNRTPGQWFRKPLLYPLSYGGKWQVLPSKTTTVETADPGIMTRNPDAEISESGAGFKRE
jgi:hypothetical protein